MKHISNQLFSLICTQQPLLRLVFYSHLAYSLSVKHKPLFKRVILDPLLRPFLRFYHSKQQSLHETQPNATTLNHTTDSNKISKTNVTVKQDSAATVGEISSIFHEIDLNGNIIVASQEELFSSSTGIYCLLKAKDPNSILLPLITPGKLREDGLNLSDYSNTLLL